MVNEYGDEWTLDAMKEAVKQGVRKLKYVDGILKSWKDNGIRERRPAGKKHSGPSTQSRETIDQANEIPF